MAETWEKAIEAAVAGQEASLTLSLTLDRATWQSGLPPRALLEQFSSLKRLSISNVGLVSLAEFPSLPRLEKLVLSGNRISGGLEHLVRADLKALRDLDLSNNGIQGLGDLQPLSQLNLVSLDLYGCPVVRAAGYRSEVFGLVRSLQYLDNFDAYGNDRLEESDEEDEVQAGDGDYEDEDDEADAGGRVFSKGAAGYPDNYNAGSNNYGNSNNEEDGQYWFDGEEGVDEEDEEEGNEDEGYNVAEEGNGHGVAARPAINVNRLYDGEGEEEWENVRFQSEDENFETDQQGISAQGEIDVEDDNGGLRYSAEGVENGAYDEGEDEEDDYDTEYLVQPINKVEEDEEGSDFEPGKDQEGDNDGKDIDDDEQGSVGKQRRRSRDSDDDERPPKRR